MSKLSVENENYAATVVVIRQLIDLPNCDNVVATPLLGYQAIVSKDTRVGDVGILFTAETQLSEEYARLNNLHRHSNLNDDESAKGYLEDNRRVKALRFRGHTSNALFMPLSSLSYADGVPDLIEWYKEGTVFDTFNDFHICRKYVRPNQRGLGQGRNLKENVRRVDAKFFPEHFDTANYFRNADKIEPTDYVTVTQKLHGTSIRVGHTVVKRKLSWVERLARRLGAKIQDTEYDYVYGSRKVTKDPNNPESNHFYGEDLWSLEGARLVGLLPKGFMVYGELIGWTSNNSPIQKGYTYGIPEGTRELYVYRVTTINPEGRQTDLSWDAVKEFCSSVGLKYVPELVQPRRNVDPGFVQAFLDRSFYPSWENALPVGKGKVDEGVVVRREGLNPLVLKAKSPIFLEHETKMLDKEEVDLEAEQSE